MAIIPGNAVLSTIEIDLARAVNTAEPYYVAGTFAFPLPTEGDSSLNVSAAFVIKAGNSNKLISVVPKFEGDVRVYFGTTAGSVKVAASGILDGSLIEQRYLFVYDPNAGTGGQFSLYVDNVLIGGTSFDLPAGASLPSGDFRAELNCYQEEGKDFTLRDVYAGFELVTAQDITDYFAGLLPNGDPTTGWQSSRVATLRAALVGTGYLGGHVVESGETVDHDTIPTGTAEGEANAPTLSATVTPPATVGLSIADCYFANGDAITDLTDLPYIVFDAWRGSELTRGDNAAVDSASALTINFAAGAGIAAGDAVHVEVQVASDPDAWIKISTSAIEMGA